MNPITTDTAFEAYEAVRHRLPPARQPGGSWRTAETLDDIADEFDVFLLDAFGVLNIGDTAIPGVAGRIAALNARGKRIVVITNAAGSPHAALISKYERMGYSFAPDDVVTSRSALLDALRAEGGRHWGLMASRQTGRRDLEGLDLTYLDESPALYGDVDAFLLLGSAEWTEACQAQLETALIERPRPVWVGNPDIVAPREHGFSKEPGHFAHRLADRTGVIPKFFGKPFVNIYDRAFARLGAGIDRARVVMVGDSLHTDVLGAQTAGVASALVAGYGFFAGYDIVGAIARAGIQPDFILQQP